MKVKLNVKERLIGLAIIPKQGNAKTLEILKWLGKTLGLSDEEQKEYEVQVKEDGRNVSWNEKGNEEKEFEFSEEEVEILRVELERLDNAKRLTFDSLTLHKKFTEVKDDGKTGAK